MPRTYSVPALLITSCAAWYSCMSFAFLPPIIVNIAMTEITAARRHAAPILQSKTNMRTIMEMTIAALPTISARLCARSVSVSDAAPSRRLRISPDAFESKNPRGAFMRWAIPCLRILVAVLNAARCVHMRAAKYTAIPATAKPNDIQP